MRLPTSAGCRGRKGIPRATGGLARPAHSSREEELAESLRENWKEDVLFELQQAVEAYDFYRRQIAQCDGQLEQYLATLPSCEPLPESPAVEVQEARSGPRRRRRRRPARKLKNQPAFDLQAHLRRILGVDATTIDGVDVMTVRTVLAEVGADLSAWKTGRHWSSWLNLAPKRDVSGG